MLKELAIFMAAMEAIHLYVSATTLFLQLQSILAQQAKDVLM
jgi:hypothetical protein